MGVVVIYTRTVYDLATDQSLDQRPSAGFLAVFQSDAASVHASPSLGVYGLHIHRIEMMTVARPQGTCLV